MLPQFTRKPLDHPLGYAVAFSGMLMQLLSYGIDNSYSIFIYDMSNDASIGKPTTTEISFGNSVLLGLSPAFGVFAGFFVDIVPPRVMIGLSTIFLFSGLWISSTFATNITFITLSYCLLASISSACMLSPGAAATSTWFNKYRGIAMGINFCGGGLGSIIIPPIAGKLVVMYGWRKTFRLLSTFCFLGVISTLLTAKRSDDDNNNTTTITSSKNSCDDKCQNERNEIEEKKEKEKNDVCMTSTNKYEEKEHKEEKDEKYDNKEEVQTSTNLNASKLSPLQLFLSLFTWAFMGNFLCWVLFSWAFFSFLFIFIPYASSMGNKDTVYVNEEILTVDKAATLFTFLGVSQVIGSIIIGSLATYTTDEFAYVLCTFIGGLSFGVLTFCRTYIAFACVTCFLGISTAGLFAVMTSLIAKRLSGPHLGFYIGAVFLAGIIGGFSAPPIQAELQVRNNGNYSYSCILMSISTTLAGFICYFAMWENKQIKFKYFF